MPEATTRKGPDVGLPLMPAKGASPDEWREFHRALFEAGMLSQSEPTKK